MTTTPSSPPLSATTTSSALQIHVHPSILQFLSCDFNGTLDKANLPIRVYEKACIKFHRDLEAPPPCDALVALALECDEQLYNNNDRSVWCTFSTATQSLLRLGQQASQEPATAAAATLLALNHLESAIRTCTAYQTGKAPLLKTMMANLENHRETRNLALVLQGLLLPTGLNLRNVLWHGFSGGLKRSWLSLAVCLTSALEKECVTLTNDVGRTAAATPSSSDNASEANAAQSTWHDLSDLATRQRTQGTNETLIRNWLPSSHHALWQLALDWRPHYPACSIALLSVLLEHGLRLAWCDANQRPEDALAHPHRFYVTLDGHGQRHVHDILVHPYCCDGARNALIANLDANATALVADLFCSASGPNMRAALAHGLWDVHLQNELERMTMIKGDENSGSTAPFLCDGDGHLHDYAAAVLLAMEMTAASCSGLSSGNHHHAQFAYQPRFSYTATTRQSLLECQGAMHQLLTGEKLKMEANDAMPAFMSKLAVPQSWFDQTFERVIHRLTSSANDGGAAAFWTVDQIYQEHDLNQLLAPMGATQQLARDVVDALTKLYADLCDARQLLENDKDVLTTRQRQRYQRVLTCGSVGAVFYGFAATIALLSLEDLLDSPRWDPKDRLKMVERSRMVVSTVQQFLTTNTERAYKAIDEYTKGKVIKQQIIAVSDELFK